MTKINSKTYFLVCMLVCSLVFLMFTPTATAGNLTTYIDFDGDDDHVTFPNTSSIDVTGTPDFTWEAWIYPESYGGNGYGRILDIFNVNTYSIFWVSSGGGLSAQFGYTGGASYAVSDGGYVDLDQWNHVVAIQENQNFTLYIDTEEPTYSQYQTGSGTHASSGENDWYMGDRYGGGRAFEGGIDEFRFYNRSITYAEVVYSFNNVEPQNQTGLVMWLRMNEGTGNTLYDETVENNDATLQPNYPDNAPDWIVPDLPVSPNILTTTQVMGTILSIVVVCGAIGLVARIAYEEDAGDEFTKLVVGYVLAIAVMAIMYIIFQGLGV